MRPIPFDDATPDRAAQVAAMWDAEVPRPAEFRLTANGDPIAERGTDGDTKVGTVWWPPKEEDTIELTLELDGRPFAVGKLWNGGWCLSCPRCHAQWPTPLRLAAAQASASRHWDIHHPGERP